MMVTDFFGNEVHVGDECAFIEPHYHELNMGRNTHFIENVV